MWVAVHAFTGLTLGVLSPFGLGLTLLAALVLHTVLDLVPHWDYSGHPRRVLWAVLDVGGAALVVGVTGLALDLSFTALAAAVISAAPDLDVFDALLTGRKRRRFFPSHWKRFPHGKASPAVGVPLQVLIMVASLAAMFAITL